MALLTLDISQLICAVGPSLITTFDEGSSVTLEFDDDVWNFYRGTDGEITRAKRPARMATARLNLPQSSSQNAILAAYLAADIIDNSGVFPFMLKDSVGEIVSAETACVIKEPNVEHGVETKMRSWPIKLAPALFSRLPL